MLCYFSFSQELTSKKGEIILPEEGDWSIGMSAHPLSNFVFNLFNDATSHKDLSTPSFGDDLYFYMKKFVSANKAIRYSIGANFDTSTESWTMGLGYGVENRKGVTRLQGMWGYHASISIGENFNGNSLVLTTPSVNFQPGYNMSLSTSMFIGCEYFIVAKMAIGAEFHYGATMHITDNQTDFRVGNNSRNTIVKINYYF